MLALGSSFWGMWRKVGVIGAFWRFDLTFFFEFAIIITNFSIVGREE
jgi:hypothetical protein